MFQINKIKGPSKHEKSLNIGVYHATIKVLWVMKYRHVQIKLECILMCVESGNLLISTCLSQWNHSTFKTNVHKMFDLFGLNHPIK